MVSHEPVQNLAPGDPGRRDFSDIALCRLGASIMAGRLRIVMMHDMHL